MMGCPDRHDLESFLAGELETAEADALTLHVEGCGVCQCLLDELAAAEPVPPHSGLYRDVSEQDLEPKEEFLDHLSRSLPHASGLYPPTGLLAKPTSTGLRSSAREIANLMAVPGYEILSELSRGGMGVVYKARQIALNRLVALKMILAGAHASATDRARLRAEAEAVARLQHPNIVQIYDIGEHEGRSYFTMELIDGPTLAQACQGQPQPPRFAAALVETLARAIHCAHQQGILHRDLKPSNVLLAKEEGTRNSSESLSADPSAVLDLSAFTPKVIDFGLVRRLDDVRLTQQGMLVGTPNYMAPEQTAGRRREASSAVDIYALGAILFELLTGRPPFTGETAVDILLQVQKNDPISVTRLHPGTPLDLATITMKCLEKDPRRRYASAAALADDLARFREGRPVRARPLNLFGRTWRWCRRNPTVASMLAVLVLVMAAGSATTLWQLQEARSNAAAESKARGDAERQTRRAEQGEAQSLLDQALLRCRQNDLTTGLLLLADCLTKAEQSGADDLPHAIRCNLAAWSRQWISVARGPSQGSPLLSVAWTPDGRLAAFGSMGDASPNGGRAEVRLWDPATWQAAGQSMPHPLAVWSLAFSPNGKMLLTGCAGNILEDVDTPGEARMWNVPSGTPVGPPLPHPAGVQAVAFSRDGTIFATGCRDGAVRLWEAATRRAIGQLPRPASRDKPAYPVRAVAFSGDGKNVLAAAGRSVWSWAVADGTARGAFPHGGQVMALAVSPDGSQVLTGCDDHSAHLWDAVSGRLLGPPMLAPETVWSVAFHPSKPLLATGSGRPSLWLLEQQHGQGAMQLWDSTALKPVAPPLTEEVGWVHAVAFSPDGQHLVTATGDGRPRRADVSRVFTLARIIRHAPQVRWVRYSPDGRSLLTVAVSGRTEPPEGEMRLWEVATGRPIGGPIPARKEGSHGPFFRIYFSPDGKAFQNHLQQELWFARDAATGNLLGPPLPEKEPAGYPLEFRPDGKQFYVLRDGAALLWDVAANRSVGPPLTHEGGHHCCRLPSRLQDPPNSRRRLHHSPVGPDRATPHRRAATPPLPD